MNKGDYVHYVSPHGKKENGRLKRMNERDGFVVFHCDDQWDNYENYTAQACKLSNLREGWVDATGNLLPEHCDHEYTDASYKWGNPNSMKCINCGKVIND